MSTLAATNLKHASSASNNIVLDSSGNATFAGTAVPASSFLRNRIINGDMRIDQRNAGASVTINTLSGSYTLDRWFATGKASAGVFTVQRLSASAPAGFTNYLACTTTTSATPGSTDAYVIGQFIEGFNVADLAWGSASAQTVTLSFRVYSSLTGTFGGSVANNAANRCYPFSFSIGSANTWTTISVTIPGDTSGTWTTDNTAGLKLYLDLGSGSSLRGTAGAWGSTFYTGVTSAVNVISTNGATFYITGVQLEVGTAATPFERRQYGQELALCQRYFEKSYNQSDALGAVTTAGRRMSIAFNTGDFFDVGSVKLSVTKRTSATITLYSPATGASGKLYNYSGSADVNGAVGSAGETAFLTTGTGGSLAANSFYGWHFAASAEL